LHVDKLARHAEDARFRLGVFFVNVPGTLAIRSLMAAGRVSLISSSDPNGRAFEKIG